MSTYKEIVGQKITKVSSDPGEPKTGQMWYNSTLGNLRGLGVVEAWISASPLTTGRFNSGAGGTTSATWIAGGYEPSASNKTEEFNGSGFESGGNLNTARGGNIGTGVITAGLTMGGGPGSSPYTSAATEEYNGSSWTTISPGLNTERLYAGAGGTQTAGVVFAGSTTPNATVRSAATEEYNGSSWTTVSGGNVNSAQSHLGGCGTQTAALKAGGDDPGGSSTNSETYDGSTWTTGNSLNTARRADGTSGIQTQAICAGGYAPPGAKTAVESYDGTSWTTSTASLSTAQYYNTTSGNTTGTGVLSMGGAAGPPAVSTVEEYHKTTNTVTAAAFSSLNSPPNAVYGGGTGGTPTAAFLVGGYGTAPAPSANRAYYQLFDGTNWSEGPDLNTARVYLGAAGTQTAALAFGGRIVSGTTNNNLSEEYDGSSWTEGPNLNTARQFGGAAGTQTAALGTCGTPPGSTSNEEYDGTNWANAPAYPQSYGNQLRTTGTQTAAYSVAGPSYSTITNTYDGSNWTSGPTCVTGIMEGNLNGTTSSAIHAGGGAGSSNYTAASQIYNNSVWYTGPNLGVGRAAMPSGPFSSSVSGSLFSGGPQGAPTYIGNQLEEYNGETTAVNIDNFTTS